MNDEVAKRKIAEELKALRAESRESTENGPPAAGLPPLRSSPQGARLPPMTTETAGSALESPSRDELNEIWDLYATLQARPRGIRAGLLALVRAPLRWLLRFGYGRALERQVAFNSAQVRFDNELVRYLDERVDRLSRHYDRVLGLHGRRMEEMDERHSILQEELVRHVHDLVERIEFVLESAETNHLYLEGLLRETREELKRLMEGLPASSRKAP